MAVYELWTEYSSLLQRLSAVQIVLGCLATPFVVVALNVLSQLMIPRNPSSPPVVFHWIPWVGSAISYGRDPLNFFFGCREKYGDMFTFILFGRRVTVALGAKGNNFVLGGKSTVFNAEDAYAHLVTPVFGHDVVYDIPNEKFMEQKKFIKVGLSVDNFRSYIGMIEDEVEDFFEEDPSFKGYHTSASESKGWSGSFDVLKVMSEITTLTASRTLQGKEIRASLDKTFAGLISDLDGGFTPLNFLFPNLPLESYRKRDAAQKKLSDFYVGIIKKRRERGVVEDDMMGSLMRQKYRDGTPVRDHEVAHMLMALLMAGQHTSAATGSWALSHIAATPDIAEALYQEQVKFFGTPDGTLRSFSYEELRQLPLMDSVIRETLRVHPPVHSIMRYVRDDVPVPTSLSSNHGIFVVPKGHYVLASPAVSQMDPLIWRASEEWDPSRWYDREGMAAQALKDYQDDNGEKIDFGFGLVSKGTDSPYQPFGAGRHRCIGEQFAYLQLGTILSMFVRHLEMRMPNGVPVPNFESMITLPKEPRDIQYRRR